MAHMSDSITIYRKLQAYLTSSESCYMSLTESHFTWVRAQK